MAIKWVVKKIEKKMDPKDIPQPPPISIEKASQQNSEKYHIRTILYESTDKTGVNTVRWDQYWEAVRDQEIPANTEREYTVTRKIGMEKSQIQKLSSSLGVDAKGLSGKLSADFETTLKVSELEQTEDKFLAPKRDEKYLWIRWRLVNLFTSVGSHTENPGANPWNILPPVNQITGLKLLAKLILEGKLTDTWEVKTSHYTKTVKDRFDPE
jgi:hypothetical protein